MPQLSIAGTDPSTLLRLVEDSGYSFAVIEDAIGFLKKRIAQIDLRDEAVRELLRAHLLAVGSPTDVGKFFSFELLCRIDENAAREVCLEVGRLLAGLELSPDRSYMLERELIRHLGKVSGDEALPLLAAISAQEAGDISRTAARAAVQILGTREKDEIQAALEERDLPQATQPSEMADAIVRAWSTSPRSVASSTSKHLRPETDASPRANSSKAFVRPERLREKERRLRAVLRESGRDPANCGNCSKQGQARVVHIIPESRGGTDRSGNLVALCRECWRRFESTRRDSSGIQRRLQQLSTKQMSLFEG